MPVSKVEIPEPLIKLAAAALAEAETDKRRKETQAQILVSLAQDAKLFHTPDGEPFATIPINGHRETWPVRTKSFKRWLARRFYELQGKPPGGQAMQDALGVLEAQAQFDGPELPIFTRIAAKDGRIYLDLANETWAAVEITHARWRVMADPPVRFRRTRGMLSLPRPVAGGSIEELRPFLNLPDEDAWRLTVAWLLAALRPSGPYPILLLQGEQGSAKSTMARVLRALIDPSSAPLRTVPRDERDLMISAVNRWVLCFDNLSGLCPWLSDALCRLSTGGGFATRELYSDAEEVIFDAMRPAILTGIDEVANRPDLLDRAIVITLPPILEERRRDEVSFWQEFEAARPRILGALLDAVSAGLRNVESVNLPRLPRMADFAVWVVACEEACPWKPDGFMSAYSGNRAEAVETALEADPVAVAVKALLAERPEWEGTAAELLAVLKPPAWAERSKAWPSSARALANKMRRLATFLRQTGVGVGFYRAGHDRRRMIGLSLDKERNSSSASSAGTTEEGKTRAGTAFDLRTQTPGTSSASSAGGSIVRNETRADTGSDTRTQKQGTSSAVSSARKPRHDAVAGDADHADDKSATPFLKKARVRL